MRRKPSLERMASRRADELTGLAGEKFIDRPGILSLDGFAGEDDRAAVDLTAFETGFVIGVVNEMAQKVGIDRPITQKWRQHYGGAPKNAALDNGKPARQFLRLSLQHDLCEEKMRGGT